MLNHPNSPQALPSSHIPPQSPHACREIRGLKDSLGSERDRQARMQQYDQERFRHLNVELQKMEERARDLQRGRDQLLVQLHDLRFQVGGGGVGGWVGGWVGWRCGDGDSAAPPAMQYTPC